jgi:hypothetical protein
MTKESRLVISLWEVIRDLIPAAKRQEVASAIIREFEDVGYDERELQDLIDEDVYLTRAYREVFDVEEEDDNDGDEE